MSKPIVYNIAKAERQIAELKQSIEELKIGEMGYQARIEELVAEKNELKKRMEKMKYDFDFINSDRSILKAENEKLKAKIEERVECGADCDKCKNKCRAWQNGFNAKGGNNHIVQIRHFNDYLAKMYTFNVPDGLTLKKGDYVLVETKGGTPKVAKCMTDSIRVNDEMLYMIMQGNKVVSSVIGRYDLKVSDAESVGKVVHISGLKEPIISEEF